MRRAKQRTERPVQAGKGRGLARGWGYQAEVLRETEVNQGTLGVSDKCMVRTVGRS